MTERLTPYRLLGESIRLMDIATPLPRCGPQEDQRKVFNSLQPHNLYEMPFCLICDDSRVYGYVTPETFEFSEPDPGPIVDKAQPVTPEMIVEGSLPLNRVLDLWCKDRQFWFILNGSQLTHFLEYSDVDKLPVKLWLFSLIMELESEMTELLSYDPDLASFIEELPRERRDRIEKTFQEKFRPGTDTPASLQATMMGETVAKLRCAQLMDKVRFVWMRPILRDRLGFESKTKYNKAFDRIERARNQIAHGDSVRMVVGPPEQLADFMRELRRMIVALNEYRREFEAFAAKEDDTLGNIDVEET